MVYKPKFGRVLIKREIQEYYGKAKIIYIPEPQQKRIAKCEGIIVGLGETAGWTEAYEEDGTEIRKQVLKIGDQVIFGRHAGAWLDSTYSNNQENDDGTLFICQDADILCVIN